MPSLTYSDIGSRMYFRPGFLLAMLVVPALSEPEPRTGSRLWTLADGRERPLRFLGTAERGTHVRFLSGRNQFTKPLSVLAESEQAAIKAFREGAWTLTSAPGLLIDPEFTLPRPAPWDWLSWYRVGTLRRWTNHNGKTLDARLLNLTDDHATLVIGERLWKQPVKDLSDADLAYLNEVKAGRALLLPGLVELTGGISWDGSRHYHSVHASGERLAAQPGPEGRFELVLAAALAHVKERFDGPVALRSLEEATTFYPKLDPPRAWLLAAPAEPFTGHTTLYRATFEAPSSRRQEVSALWPATTSPSTWPQLEWYVYFLPDAQPAPVTVPMIDRLLALLFLSFVAPTSAQTPPSAAGIMLHCWSLGDGISDAFMTYSFRVPEADLRKTPAWEPSEGAPPLPRDAALRLAREALTEEERGRTSTDHPVITLEQPNPHDKRLGPVPADSCRWFYTITFPKQSPAAILAQFKAGGIVAADVLAGGTDAVHLLITMSRTVVRPSKELVTR